MTGRGRAGLPFDCSWSFTVRIAAPIPISLTIRLPGENATVGRTFDAEGTTVAKTPQIPCYGGSGNRARGSSAGARRRAPAGNFLYLGNDRYLFRPANGDVKHDCD